MCAVFCDFFWSILCFLFFIICEVMKPALLIVDNSFQLDSYLLPIFHVPCLCGFDLWQILASSFGCLIDVLVTTCDHWFEIPCRWLVSALVFTSIFLRWPWLHFWPGFFTLSMANSSLVLPVRLIIFAKWCFLLSITADRLFFFLQFLSFDFCVLLITLSSLFRFDWAVSSHYLLFIWFETPCWLHFWLVFHQPFFVDVLHSFWFFHTFCLLRFDDRSVSLCP